MSRRTQRSRYRIPVAQSSTASTYTHLPVTLPPTSGLHHSRVTPLYSASSSRERTSSPLLPRIVSDPHGDDVHAEWDQEIVETGLEPGPDLLRLLVTQCETLNPEYRDIQAASILYDSDILLREELKMAWRNKSFKSIRQLVILQSSREPTIFQHADAEAIRVDVKTLIEIYEGQMLRCTSGLNVINMWKPRTQSHARLKIPESLPGIPDVLIHELGEWSGADGPMEKSIPTLFRPKRNTFLFNVSGSGKTRLALEGLCQNWGFYFTCAKDMISHQGSSDVTSAIKDVSYSTKFYPKVKLRPNNSAVQKNRARAETCFLRLWLSRLIVFELYLKCLSSATTLAESRRLWLLIQLFPHKLMRGDIFDDMYQRLRRADTVTLKTMIDEMHGSAGTCLQTREPLFAVFDEAQCAVRQRHTAFTSDDYTSYIPILGEIIASFENLEHEVTIIVSGTCPFTTVRRNSSTSPIGESGGWHLFTSTGAFDDRNAQEQYIMRYVWPDVTDKDKLLPQEQAILDRAWCWLRGRHRLTATLVQLLLQHGVGSGHRLFTAYFEQVTKYCPIDIPEHSNHEAPLTHSVHDWVKRVSPIYPSQLATETYESVKGPVLQHLLKSLFRSETTVLHIERDLFVELGFAHFWKPTTSDNTEVLMDEPIALMSVASWLDSYLRGFKYSEIRGNCERHGYINVPVSLELLAFYFQILFDGRTALDELVDFATKRPSWARQPAQILAAFAEDEDGMRRTCVATLKTGPSPTFGFCASTEADTLDWLTDSRGVPFCFPNANFGSDILFLVEVDEQLIWVAVHAKIGAQDTPSMRCAEQLESLDDTDGHAIYATYDVLRSGAVLEALMPFYFPLSQTRAKRRRVQDESDPILQLVVSPSAGPFGKTLKESISQYPAPVAFVNLAHLVEMIKQSLPTTPYDREPGRI